MLRRIKAIIWRFLEAFSIRRKVRKAIKNREKEAIPYKRYVQNTLTSQDKYKICNWGNKKKTAFNNHINNGYSISDAFLMVENKCKRISND